MKSIAAAFTLFTRLPFWRVAHLSAGHYQQAIAYWPMTGWLTGGVAAAVLYGALHVVPLSVAVILALIARLLLTGALHEDGLSDFLDGFGGGTSREKVLAIMKDSHSGSYGVIGLIAYFGLLATVLISLPLAATYTVLLCGDPLAKFTAGMTVNFLPYARPAEDSKTKVVYTSMRLPGMLCAAVFGLLPMLLLLHTSYWIAGVAPFVVVWLLIRLMRRRIGGYTGDCCGATFLLCELSFYLALLILSHSAVMRWS